MIHPQWCKDVDEGWAYQLENFQDMIKWTYIHVSIDGSQYGEKVLLNHST